MFHAVLTAPKRLASVILSPTASCTGTYSTSLSSIRFIREMTRRAWEWWSPRIIGLGCGIAYLVLFRKLPLSPGLKDVFSAVLTVASITVGFLITAAGTLLAVQGDHPILRTARQAGAYRLLIEYIISAARWNFTTAVVSATALVVDWQHPSKGLIYGIAAWIVVIAVALLTVVRVFKLLAEVLRASSSIQDD